MIIKQATKWYTNSVYGMDMLDKVMIYSLRQHALYQAMQNGT